MNDDWQRTTATAVYPPTAAALDDHAFLRYSRQLLLEDIGIEGQQRLQAATVLLAGLGALGSPATLYLAAAASASPVRTVGSARRFTR